MILQKDEKFDQIQDVSNQELEELDDISESQLKLNKIKPSSEIKVAKKGVRSIFSGLKFKVAIIATLLGAVPVFIVGVNAYNLANKTISNQIARDKIAESSKIADGVHRFFVQRIANIKTLTKLINIIDPQFPVFTDENQQALEDSLTQFYLDYLVFENIAIYDLTGNVLIQSRQSAPELNQAEFPYFQTVAQGNNIVISEPINSRGEPVIYIASPLKNDQNQNVGVLAGKIPLNFVSNALLKSTNLSEDTRYKIVDSNGIILDNLQDFEEPPLPIGNNIAQRLPSFTEYNQEKIERAWKENEESASLNAYVPVKKINNLEWGIVTSTPISIAFAIQNNLRETIIQGTLITAIVAVIVGIFLAIIGISPITKLSEIVSELGRGNLDTRAPVKGNDEIAVLGDNINKMASDIQNLLNLSMEESLALQKQNEVFSELGKNEALLEGDSHTAIPLFTQTIADTLNVSKVGVWLYNSELNLLQTFDLYDSIPDEHFTDIEINTSKIEDYLEVLRQNKIIVANDITTHPLTQTLAPIYLQPNNIVSLLAIPIVSAGNTIGILTCEQVKETRNWKPQEQTLVSSIANLVALVLENEANQNEVGEILEVVSDVEEGNLTVKAKVSDRATGLVADTLNRLIEELAEVMQEVYESAGKVQVGSKNSQMITNKVAQNTVLEVASVEEVLNLSKQVESAANLSSEEVEKSRQALMNLSKAINLGKNTILRLRDGIGTLTNGREQLIQEIKALGEFVGLAEQFVQDQNEIAQKTQVLALNASLVATRAAQQKNPQRFATVAQEFQNIAEQVSTFAEQTNDDLETLEKRTNQIQKVVSVIDTEVQSLDSLVDEFNEGVQESDQLFSEVTIVTKEAINRGEAITEKNEDIMKYIDQTITAIQEISKVAKNTKNMSEETLLQTKEMEGLSNELLERVKFFKLPTNN